MVQLVRPDQFSFKNLVKMATSHVTIPDNSQLFTTDTEFGIGGSSCSQEYESLVKQTLICTLFG